MKNINSKKGFTLIELLAVIVILAVLILIAMPSVLRMMENARRNAFVVEANRIIKIAQTAYAEEALYANGASSWCRNLAALKSEGYLDKNLGDYKGYITITRTPQNNASTGKADYDVTTVISISNDNYTIKEATSDDLAHKDFTKSDKFKSGGTTETFECPAGTDTGKSN